MRVHLCVCGNIKGKIYEIENNTNVKSIRIKLVPEIIIRPTESGNWRMDIMLTSAAGTRRASAPSARLAIVTVSSLPGDTALVEEARRSSASRNRRTPPSSSVTVSRPGRRKRPGPGSGPRLGPRPGPSACSFGWSSAISSSVPSG